MSKARQKNKFDFSANKGIETTHLRKLKQVSREVGRIISNVRSDRDLIRAEEMLLKYSDLLKPWAEEESLKLLQDIAAANDRKWSQIMRSMGRQLRTEAERGALMPTIATLRPIYAKEIVTVPLKTAERLRQWSRESLYTGIRPEDYAEKMAYEEHVSLSDAKRIARTETSTATTLLTEARAQSVGSDSYIWRTVGDDGRTRESHLEMEGVVCEWANPPTLSDGTTTHAGAIYNCRCWPEVIL